MGISGLGGLLFHGSGGLVDHEDVMLLMPALPIVLLVVIVGVNVARDRGYLAGMAAELDVSAPLAAIGAALSLGAAGIHFSVIGDHLEVDFAEGLFFLVVGWFQLIWAMAYLLRPARVTRLVGAVGNALVIGGWLVSRTTGLPIGPDPWVPQPVGMADLFATSFEIVLVSLLVGALLPRSAHRFAGDRLPLEKALVLAVFSVTTVSMLTGVALLGVPD